MATPNELINELTADFLSSKGLEYVWEQACRKFFVKTGQVAGTESEAPDSNLLALSTITAGETSSNHKLGLFRRTEGAPSNTWILDDTKYVIGASISASGIVLDRMNPDGTEEETGKPLIAMSAIKTAIGLKSAAYLEANNTAGNIPLLDSNGHLELSIFPDAILGQVIYGGQITGSSGSGSTLKLQISISAKAKAKIEKNVGREIGTRAIWIENQETGTTWTSAIAYLGWKACEGVYFINSITAQTTFAGEQYNVGDWCISTGGAWKKVDNTDAVTGIKFLKNGTYTTEIGEVIVSCDKVGALDLFTTSKQTMLGDLEIGTSSSAKGLSAWGGVAAHGIGDLTSGGGGGGTSGVNILRNWANYDSTDETQVLGTNLAKAMKDNVTSKGDATHPVYFNANGVAQQITSYAGNAATASELATARSITIGNKSNNFNGSANISFTLDEIGAVAKNNAITGATKCKITYDSKGLVTRGTDLAESDIPSLAISKITGLQNTLIGKQNTIEDYTDTYTGTKYVSNVNQSSGRIAVTHKSFTKPTITLSSTKLQITTDGGASDEITIPTWNQNTTGSAAKLTNARKITIGYEENSFDGSDDITYNLSDVGALDTVTTIAQTIHSDLTVGTEASRKSIAAFGGVAAHGISDLTSGGGGGGTSGVNILRDWANYDSTDETQVLGTNLAKAMKDNVTSKGDATHPVYFNANGVAQQITSYAGNAATASELQTARNITIGSETHSFDGSANITFDLATIGAVAKNNAITGATKCKITYDSKGLVTGGENLALTDIPTIPLNGTDIHISGTLGVANGGTGKTTITAGAMLYASAANTYGEVTTTAFGRGLLNATSSTKVTGLYADKAGKDSDDNNIAEKFTITSSVLQSLQSQIDSVASRDAFDELKVSVLTADIIAAQNIYGVLHGNADKVEHALTIKKNGTTLYAFDGSAARTLELDYSLTVNGTEEEPTGFSLAIDSTEIDLVALTATEIRNICI